MTVGIPTLEELARAFGYVESSNNYGEIGPNTRSGDRAYGYYQVMGQNIPSWTERWVGRRMTPEEYLASPEAQDAVFYGQMGQYFDELPDASVEARVRNAASRWFTGQPYNPTTAGYDDTYITNQEYGDRVLARLGMNGDTAMTMDPNAPQAGGFMGGVQNTLGGIGDAISGWFQPWRDAPLTGGAEDPFSNLSRQQRMMLGFAALRDAGAALQGQESSYFSDALGVFDQGRERERLRRQGALQNLAALQQARAYAAFSGDQQALSAFDAALADVYAQLGVGGAPSAALGVTSSAPGVAPTTAAPTATPTGGAAAQPPQTTQQEIDAIDEELARLASGPMLNVDTSALMQVLMAERDRLSAALEETAVTAQERAAAIERAQTVELPRIEAALEYLVRGTDENGDPVIDSQFTGPLGMEAFRNLHRSAYNDLQNILTTVRSGQLLATLQQVTTGALSENEIAIFGGTRGTLDINDPIGTVRTLIQIQQELQRLLAEQSSAPQNNPFTDID